MSLTYLLQRVTSNSVCTLGVMKDENNHPICVTLELPDLNNQPMVSCIPAGIYECNQYMSPKRGYEVFELQGVPDRTAIEIHIGNFPADTDGCILLGTSYEKNSIAGSKDAFNKFMAGLEGIDSFTLKVQDAS